MHLELWIISFSLGRIIFFWFPRKWCYFLCEIKPPRLTSRAQHRLLLNAFDEYKQTTSITSILLSSSNLQWNEILYSQLQTFFQFQRLSKETVSACGVEQFYGKGETNVSFLLGSQISPQGKSVGLRPLTKRYQAA